MRAEGTMGTKPPLHLFRPVYDIEPALALIRECLTSGWTGLGNLTLRFEDDWKTYTGLPHAHMTNSATAALHLAVRLLRDAGRWKDGDEVISTPLTFVSTNHAILYERLKVRFADVDESLCLDPESVVKRITKRTRAVMYVGLGGNAGRLSDIYQICRHRKLALILDASHCAGTQYMGSHIGVNPKPDAAVFSFHSVKNLPTADAGMLCMKDERLDARARRMSWLGIDKTTADRTRKAKPGYAWRYDCEDVGFKYHGNSIMAALGIVGLKKLDAHNEHRRALAANYRQLLAFHELLTEARRCVMPIYPSVSCLPSRHLYQVLLPAERTRDRLMAHLNADGIFPGVHYRTNAAYPMYRKSGQCPRAEDYSRRLMSLPLHVGMTPEDCIRVVESMRRFFTR